MQPLCTLRQCLIVCLKGLSKITKIFTGFGFLNSVFLNAWSGHNAKPTWLGTRTYTNSCHALFMYLFTNVFILPLFFRASYIEIYNEKVNDLLEKGKTGLKLREVEGNTIICGVKEEVVHTPDKVKIRFV